MKGSLLTQQPQREMGKAQGLVQVTAQSSTKMCFWEGAKVLKGDGSPCSFCWRGTLEEWFVFCFGTGWRAVYLGTGWSLFLVLPCNATWNPIFLDGQEPSS